MSLFDEVEEFMIRKDKWRMFLIKLNVIFKCLNYLGIENNKIYKRIIYSLINNLKNKKII